MKFYQFFILMAAIYIAPHLPMGLAAVGGAVFLVAGIAVSWLETRSNP